MMREICITRLEAGAAAIAALARGVDATQAIWRPNPSDWSILEVVNHLYDEEREDFRLRIDLTLHQPETPLPPINPEGWVIERRYNERDLSESLANFLEERHRSLEWLLDLSAETWEREVNHPQLGGLRAGDLLVSWAAHDMLHIRQLNELHYAYLRSQSAPYTPDYAGRW